MTTPAQVNRVLKRLNDQGDLPHVEIVRHPSGYYWFFDYTTQIRSIYSFNLRGFSTQEIVKHVQNELKRIAEEG